MKRIELVPFVLMFVLLALSCNKTTNLGEDLLSQDQANVSFTDSITVLTSTVVAEELKTFDPDPTNQLANYPC